MTLSRKDGTAITFNQLNTAPDYKGSPLEVAEGRWNKSRKTDMDVGLAFGGLGRPIGSVSDFIHMPKEDNFVGASWWMQGG